MSDPRHPDDDFDARARRAGEALRRPAPEGGLAAVHHARARRRATAIGLAGAGVLAIVGIVVLAMPDHDSGAPIGTELPTSVTVTPTSSTSTIPPSSTIPGATTGPGPSTTDSTTSTTSTTTPPCPAAGGVTPVESTDSARMSGLVGADIRTGRHPCFDRIVIELQGPGQFPGWTAAYVDDPQRIGESDEFADIAGNATLSVRLNSWMQDMDGAGYPGPNDIFPTNVDSVQEMRLMENFEGVTIWAFGLDREHPFVITELQGPPRLVIDLYH